MRIGIVCHATYGGSSALAAELACELAERGHYVHVISDEVPFRLAPCEGRVAFHAVEVPSYPLFRYPPYLLALAAKIAEVATYEGLDLVHAHYAIPHAPAAALAAQMAGDRSFAVVVTLHGTDVTRFGRDESLRSPLLWSLAQAQQVTAVSDWLAEQARLAFRLPAIRRIYNFIDPRRVAEAPDLTQRSRWAAPGEAVLIHVSNFRPVKNVADVIRIFARVAAEQPARLLLVGDGPDSGQARRLARELGLTERIAFLGAQPEAHPFLAASDVFLLPSSQESFGLAALEAMACGVPVVASRTGGLPEVVPEGQAGFLCPVGDVEAMAQRCLQILAALPRFREGARQWALSRFTADRIVPEYEGVYEEAVRRHNGLER